MRNLILSVVITFLCLLNAGAQWEMIGKVSTSSQFELAHTGITYLSIDSTQILLFNGRYLATFDIRTNTLTNFEKEFNIGDVGGPIIMDYKRNRILCAAWDSVRAYDNNTHKLISKSSIGIAGTGPSGFLTDQRRDELIVTYRGYDSAGAILILSLADFSKKFEFITKYKTEGGNSVILDEK